MVISGLLFFFLIFFFFTTLFKDKKTRLSEKPVATKKVEHLDLTRKSHDVATNTSTQQTSSYFLKPSPGELMEKFAKLTPHELKQEAQDLPGLRIMWPAYYFSSQEGQLGTTTLFLDTLESGFGITIVCDIDSNQYPQIKTIQRGKKIWLAGEIKGINPEGVGEIHIAPEHIKLEEDSDWIIPSAED